MEQGCGRRRTTLATGNAAERVIPLDPISGRSSCTAWVSLRSYAAGLIRPSVEPSTALTRSPATALLFAREQAGPSIQKRVRGSGTIGPNPR